MKTTISPLLSICAALLMLLLFTSATALERIRVGGSGTNLATFKAIAYRYAGTTRDSVEFDVLPSLGSGGGIKALRDGKIDLALLSRPPRPAEEKGIKILEYARSPLLLVTNGNPDSPPSQPLTRDQLISLYCEPPDQRTSLTPHSLAKSLIRPIIRPAHDSDTLLLTRAVPELKQCIEDLSLRKGIPIATSDQSAAMAIETTPGAFGTSTLTVIRAEHRRLVPIPLGLGPDASVQPIGEKRLFLAFDPKKGTPHINELIVYIQSQEGAALLRDFGNRTIGEAQR